MSGNSSSSVISLHSPLPWGALFLINPKTLHSPFRSLDRRAPQTQIHPLALVLADLPYSRTNMPSFVVPLQGELFKQAQPLIVRDPPSLPPSVVPFFHGGGFTACLYSDSTVPFLLSLFGPPIISKVDIPIPCVFPWKGFLSKTDHPFFSFFPPYGFPFCNFRPSCAPLSPVFVLPLLSMRLTSNSR